MKKDIRVQYPLYQMAFIVLFGFMAFSIIGVSKEFNHNSEGFSYSLEFNPIESILLLGALFISSIAGLIFIRKIYNHNKQHPDQKLSMWQIKPIEFLEQDEGMTHITRRAAQKVYTFFVWALPFFAVIFMVFELPRFWVIMGILFLALMQYLIYYVEIRKHLKEDDES
ncbi:MAG TPA: hypothetical protein VLQ66_04435 [Paenisporosarcina sp.]|nr:hypothetical protein [Paenisporosarcina sp.]